MKRMITWATRCSVLVLLHGAQAAAPPPLFDIVASSRYDAGVQHGRLAASRIKGWLATKEMTALLAYVQGAGRHTFERLKHDNSQAFPQSADELRGIADGAGVPLDSVWVANLIEELEILGRLHPDGPEDHCSDIYAVAEGGPRHGFAHGHNEDWSRPVEHLWYFVKYTAASGANFSSCAGQAYPGSLIGWAATWNAKGMYLTQNTLLPKKNRHRGLASAFAQREAICGAPGGARGLEEVVGALARPGWSSGASVNVVDLRARRMANVELYEDQHSVWEVTAQVGTASNYSHFNMFKHLERARHQALDGLETSTMHRQARVDMLPAPRTREDIMEVLSDSTDNDYPIYRDVTLATFVLDGRTGTLDVWCGTAARASPAAYSWSLFNFFGNASHADTATPALLV